MNSYKLRRNMKPYINTNINSITNNIVMTYPLYLPTLEHNNITLDTKREDDIWGQFVDIESMTFFNHRCKKNHVPPTYLNTVTENPEDDEDLGVWYNNNISEHSSICSRAELLLKFVMSIFYGFATIYNFKKRAIRDS